MIRDEKRSEVEEELRRQVDVLMREELDLLKIVRQTIVSSYDQIQFVFCPRLWREIRVRKAKSAKNVKESRKRPAKKAKRRKIKI